MKKMTFAAALFFAAITMSSCVNKSQKENTSSEIETATDSAMSIDSLLANAEKLNKKNVTIEGVCTHICKHGGRKIFLMGSDDTQTIRVEATQTIGKFKQECVNSLVKVNGKLVEDRIDEEYLSKWEEQVAAQQAEKHGDNQEVGCSTEKKARGEQANTVAGRIADFRKKIAQRAEKEGKRYLSFYHIDGTSYEIVE